MDTTFNPLTIHKVRRIGVFDSGLGGLTVLDELVRHYPQADYIYFGDNARAPYGDRTGQEITQFAEEIIDFLLTCHVDALIIACNTISVHAAKLIKEKHADKLVIGTVEAALDIAQRKIDACLEQDPEKACKLGLIATAATITSDAYQGPLAKRYGQDRIIAYKTPRLVPLIEKDDLDIEDRKSLIEEELGRMKAEQVNFLLLGCTHYPLLEEEIQAYLGPDVELINPAIGMAQELGDYITWTRNIGSLDIYTSGNPDKYRRLIDEKLLRLKRANIEKVKLH